MTAEHDRVSKLLNATINVGRNVKPQKGPDGKVLLDHDNRELSTKVWHAQLISNADKTVIAEAEAEEKEQAIDKVVEKAKSNLNIPSAPLTGDKADAQWKSGIESAIAQMQAQLAELSAILSDMTGEKQAQKPAAPAKKN